MFSASSFVLEFKVYIQGFGNVFLWPTVFVCILQVPQSLCSCGFWGGQKYVWHILKYVPCILKKVGHIFSEVLMEFFRYNFFFHFFHACVIPENKGAGFGHGVKPFWESATFVNQSCRNVCNISHKTWHFDVFDVRLCRENSWHGSCIYISEFRKVLKPGGFKKDMYNN